jgi:hypothetical protein
MRHRAQLALEVVGPRVMADQRPPAAAGGELHPRADRHCVKARLAILAPHRKERAGGVVGEVGADARKRRRRTERDRGPTQRCRLSARALIAVVLDWLRQPVSPMSVVRLSM